MCLPPEKQRKSTADRQALPHSVLIFGDVLFFARDCYRDKSGWEREPDTGMPKSSSKLKILYSEGDAEVLASQAVSIQKAGHEVIQAVGRKAVEEALRRESFDLVVLGPTLTKNDRHHLPYMVKKCQNGTRVLVMHTDGERHPSAIPTPATESGSEPPLKKMPALPGPGPGLAK